MPIPFSSVGFAASLSEHRSVFFYAKSSRNAPMCGGAHRDGFI
jgi:hypothetical protein